MNDVLARSRRELSIDASLGVWTVPAVEEISFEIRPAQDTYAALQKLN